MPTPAPPLAGAPVTPPPRPTLALPPRPVLQRGLWALPLLLSLVFVAAVLAWLRGTERADLEQQRLELISDALSLEAQVSARIEREAQLLRELAARLAANPLSAGPFAAQPEVQQGMRRFWISLTGLDNANRITAHLPEQAPRPGAAEASVPQSVGLTAHRHGGGLRAADRRHHLDAAAPGARRVARRSRVAHRSRVAQRDGRLADGRPARATSKAGSST